MLLRCVFIQGVIQMHFYLFFLDGVGAAKADYWATLELLVLQESAGDSSLV